MKNCFFRLFLFSAALIFTSLGSLSAQTAVPSASPAPGSNLDDVFDTVQSDTVVTGPQPKGVSSQPSRPTFLYFGTVETQGVMGDGWASTTPMDTTPSMWYYLHLKGGLDVQPAPQIRLLGTFSTYLPSTVSPDVVSNLNSGTTQNGMSTTTVQPINPENTVSIDELFLDYTVGDKAQFRAGQFVTTWGQGRIFNPGNLVSGTSGGVNMKGFISEGPLSLTALIIGNTGYFANKAQPLPQELGTAGMAELALGPVSAGLSAVHQNQTGSTEDLYLRSSLLGFDIYTDVLATQAGGPQTGQWYPEFLGGIFREIDIGWKFRVDGEYWYNGNQITGTTTQNIGFGLDTDSFEGIKMSLKWTQSLTDGSGQLITGFSSTPLPYMNVNLGIPFTYGPGTGTYVAGNADPEHRLLAVLLSVNLKFNYEKAR